MIKKSTTCDLIVEDIKKNIVDGIMVPGEKLPTERDLAENYGVSRLPVREALRVLRELGFLETKHGKGTFVKEQSGFALSKEMASYFMMNKDSVFEIFELRRILEIDLARLAALHGTEEEKAEIVRTRKYAEEEILKMRDQKDNEFLEADQAFHRALGTAAHNQVLVDIFLGIQEYFTMYQVVSLSATKQLDDVVKYHRRIEDAIIRGSEEDAEAAMRSHMRRIEELLHLAIEKKQG